MLIYTVLNVKRVLVYTHININKCCKNNVLCYSRLAGALTNANIQNIPEQL